MCVKAKLLYMRLDATFRIQSRMRTIILLYLCNEECPQAFQDMFLWQRNVGYALKLGDLNEQIEGVICKVPVVSKSFVLPYPYNNQQPTLPFPSVPNSCVYVRLITDICLTMVPNNSY